MSAHRIPLEAARAPLAYLGTPYTNYRTGLHQAFLDAARLAGALQGAGVNVYSPIVHSHVLAIYGEIDPLDRAIWLPVNEPTMAAASVLIVGLLEGWDS